MRALSTVCSAGFMGNGILITLFILWEENKLSSPVAAFLFAYWLLMIICTFSMVENQHFYNPHGNS